MVLYPDVWLSLPWVQRLFLFSSALIKILNVRHVNIQFSLNLTFRSGCDSCDTSLHVQQLIQGLRVNLAVFWNITVVSLCAEPNTNVREQKDSGLAPVNKKPTEAFTHISLVLSDSMTLGGRKREAPVGLSYSVQQGGETPCSMISFSCRGLSHA